MRGAAEVRGDWLRALQRTAALGRGTGTTLPGVLEGVAAAQGDRPALLADGAVLTYQGFAEQVNRTARWARAHGIGPGGTVALLMPNRPEYPAAWLGVARAGAAAALLNINLTGAALLHAVRLATPAHLVVDASLAQAVQDIMPSLPAGLRLWVQPAADGSTDVDLPAERMDEAVQACDPAPLPHAEFPMPALGSRALLIYSSGTTGLPKAVVVPHRRVAEWALWFAGMMDVAPDDKMVLCLPMYHPVGGVALLGAALAGGASVLVRERFSAGRFWDDAADFGCTLFPYVGELCRYLADAPPHPRESEHRLRMACGNGMRGDVWARFQARFRLPRILEFYAATEGAVSLYNCGRSRARSAASRPSWATVPPLPWPGWTRRAWSRCGRAGPLPSVCAGRARAELLGRLPDGAPAASYTDRAASERKVIRGAFAEGDAWFRSGDLVLRDRDGFYRFVDRLGDTFRWKGENVSAAELEDTARLCPGVLAAAAYGVPVPGAEGRAGMLAVVAGEGFVLATLRQVMAERLPSYARPLFVRRCDRIEETGTFKPMKARLQREGWEAAADVPVWFDDHAAGAYVWLDAALRARLLAGTVR